MRKPTETEQQIIDRLTDPVTRHIMLTNDRETYFNEADALCETSAWETFHAIEDEHCVDGVLNIIGFSDATKTCLAPIWAFALPNGRIEVVAQSLCEKIIFHRYVGQYFITHFNEEADPIEMHTIFSRKDAWNKAHTAANGGEGEAAGFNSPRGGRIQHINGQEVRV